MITSAEEFMQLRLSAEPDEYRRAATEEAPEAVWLDLIERFPEMREWAALNKTLPENVLWKLVRDEDRRVRFQVAMRRRLTEDMFSVLASDEDDGVRSRVCWNKRAPQPILERLAKDNSPMVAEAARRRLAQ
jgi:hypothetical protein